MALIHCPECQKEVSSVALACPQCAFPYPGRKEAGNGHYDKTLRTCPDCQRIISRQVKMCPHCGAPTPEIDEIPEPLVVEESEETIICPHCGEPVKRSLKARKPVEEPNRFMTSEETSMPAQSILSSQIAAADASQELIGESSFPVERKRKPLWQQRNENPQDWPRHSKHKRGWNPFLLVTLVLLTLLAGWAFWEFSGMSGLEALVFWNL
jgi:hypothetical protein